MARNGRPINDYAALLTQVGKAKSDDKPGLILGHSEKITNFSQLVRLLDTLSGTDAAMLMLTDELKERITTVKQLGQILDLLHKKKSDPHLIAAIIRRNEDKIEHRYQNDLTVYPTAMNPPSPSTELTIGDLHGNAMKLIYFLIREGAINGITPSNYAELMMIYETPVADLTPKQIARFNAIVNQIDLNPVGKIRLIGDTLSDRGANDYYTLMILDRLRRLNAPLEIEISNHDVDFLQASRMVKGEIQFRGNTPLDNKKGPSQIQSRLNLNELIERFPELRAEVTIAVENAYTPFLKLIGYTLSPDGKGISLYTHAPVGLETIKALADRFYVPYRDGSAQELAGTIDAINQEVQNSGGVEKLYKNFDISDQENPLSLIIWNRYQDNRALDRPEHKNDGANRYSLHFVHGHDTSAREPLPKNVSNLDSEFGKYSREVEADFLRKGKTLSLNYLCHRTEAAPPAATARLDTRSPSDLSYDGFRTETHPSPGSSPRTLDSNSPAKIPGSPEEEEDEDGDDDGKGFGSAS